MKCSKPSLTCPIQFTIKCFVFQFTTSYNIQQSTAVNSSPDNLNRDLIDILMT